MKMAISDLCERFEKAKRRRMLWESLWDDCYQLSMPARASYYNQNVPGEDRSEDIYDSTAVTSLQEFANRMQDSITPNFAPWFKLVPGQSIPEEEVDEVTEQLDAVTNFTLATIQRSNFSRQVHEIYQDLAVGTAALSVEDDEDDLIRFHAAPMPTVYLERAPNGSVDCVFREHTEIRGRDVKIRWPDASLPPDLQTQLDQNEDKEICVVEVNYRDWSDKGNERYHWQLLIPEKKTELQHIESIGQGSKVWITPRWSVGTGEVFGRGPLLQALPDIRTLNLVVQMELENAELAIAGIWQADDNNVIHPSNIQIVPGTVIPRRPGTRGLEPLAPASDFNVSQLIVEKLQDNIRLALFNQRLGSLQRTPRSATEILERQGDLAKLIGSAFGRLQEELAAPIIKRVLYLLKRKGLVELPRIDGQEIAIQSTSPLARAQRLDDVNNIAQFVTLTTQLYGPEQAKLQLNASEGVKQLARHLEIPANLLNDEAQQQEALETFMQLAGGMQGDDVPTA